MPSRKQRRRRAKERRHEYEYVYVDEEGHEVEVEPEESKAPERQGPPARAAAAGGPASIQPPSWQRVGRRALIFGPLMFITIRLLERGEPIAASMFRTVFLLLIFLPFSYVMDAVMYRTYQRRIEPRLEALAGRAVAAAVVALAGPRREQEQDLGAGVARDHVALVGLERDAGCRHRPRPSRRRPGSARSRRRRR